MLLAQAGCTAGGSAPPPPPRGGGPTIVSLNPCSDAILAEVADPAQIRGLSRYSSDPAQSSMDAGLARRFPVMSGAVEGVLAARPDVTVASVYTDPASLAAMRRLGLRVQTVTIANSLAEARDQVRQLAALAGHPDRGEALVARIDRAVAAAAPPRGARPIATVLWEPGGIVPGRETLVSDAMARAGFSNFSAQRGLGQAQRLPLERMLVDPPRLILAVGGGAGSVPEDDRLLVHPALAALKGTAHATLAPGLIFCGGPTIPRLMARLAQVRRQVELAR